MYVGVVELLMILPLFTVEVRLTVTVNTRFRESARRSYRTIDRLYFWLLPYPIRRHLGSVKANPYEGAERRRG